MHRRSFSAFTASIAKHWLVPAVLEVIGLVTLLWGRSAPVIPQPIAWLFVVAGVFVAGYLAYHDLYVTTEEAKKGASSTHALRRVVFKRLNWKQRMTLSGIAEAMERNHGHADTEALEQEYCDGVLLGDLLNRPCTICANGTLRKESKYER